MAKKRSAKKAKTGKRPSGRRTRPSKKSRTQGHPESGKESKEDGRAAHRHTSAFAMDPVTATPADIFVDPVDDSEPPDDDME